MFERYANGGDNAQLKAFAKKTLPHLKQHLQMAEGLNKSNHRSEIDCVSMP